MAETTFSGPGSGRKLSGTELPQLQRFRVNRVGSLAQNPPAGDVSFHQTIHENEMLDFSGNASSAGVPATTAKVPPSGRRGSTYSLSSDDGYDGRFYAENDFNQFTREALPRIDNYRNLMSIQAAQRPTLDELRDDAPARKEDAEAPDPSQVPTGNKFNWVQGVLVRCLLNIWGVMLFLRLSWMVAQAGILEALGIIAISTLITGLTTISMAAICTNGEIKGGGFYYMISRSIGPEFGASIGVVFSFANAANAALNTVGFSESLRDMMKTYFDAQIVDGDINDMRITGTIALVVMQSIIFIGMEWEAKVQVALLVVLLIAMVDFMIGAFVGPISDSQISRGFIGLNYDTFMDNLYPRYTGTESFATVFGVFFPAVAGIQAGASISGDLADPSRAIPLGTLTAIGITSGSYAFFGMLDGAGCLRSASGVESEVASGYFKNCTDRTCSSGMYNDMQVMSIMSIFAPLIYAGCFAATLSSALSCLVSGPKTFQALCRDEIYPKIGIFGKGYGKADDPRWGYILSFIIALIFILIADLNAIAPLISNFFLIAYAMLNFCTFHSSLIKSVGWRPEFKYYNKWISLFASVLCIAAMFYMDWPSALITVACVIFLYAWVAYRKPDVNWGSSAQAQTYKNAVYAIQHLSTTHEHVKNYRPQILLLSGSPQARPPLVDFAYLITKNLSVLICACISEEPIHPRTRSMAIMRSNNWLLRNRTKAFFTCVDAVNFEEGARHLMSLSGIGRISPNVIMMGYKSNWQTCDKAELVGYFNVLHNAFDHYMAIAILRLQEGLDYTGMVKEKYQVAADLTRNESYLSQLSHTSDEANDDPSPMDPEEKSPTSPTIHAKIVMPPEAAPVKRLKKGEDPILYETPEGHELPPDVRHNITQFKQKQGKGCIDVWWLYDDGGLSLLLPYIIHTRKLWVNCKLRVFVIGNKREEMELEQRTMASLLSKFRIDYTDLIVIPDITKKAKGETKMFFNSLIKQFRGISDPDNLGVAISEDELSTHKEKTNRHLRLRELLIEHSRESRLIVMTLPIPRRGAVSSPLYMAWLEVLTQGMPPYLLVRGNQTSVLTFYS